MFGPVLTSRPSGMWLESRWGWMGAGQQGQALPPPQLCTTYKIGTVCHKMREFIRRERVLLLVFTRGADTFGTAQLC